MSFDIYRSRRSISGQSASVRANYDVSTSAQLVGRAISQAGSVLMSLGEKWDLQQADTQFTKAKAEARQEHNRFLISLESIEPDDYQKAFENSIKKRQLFMPKNKRAARQYGNWLTILQTYWNEDKNQYMKAALNDNGRAIGFVLQQEAIQTGRMDEYFIHLAKGTRLGYYDKEEAAKLRKSTIYSHEKYLEEQEMKSRRDFAYWQAQLRDETGRKMLVDLWNGTLSDDSLSSAVEKGLLSETQGKYLKNALLNPEPPETTYDAVIAIEDTIAKMGEGIFDTQSATNVVMKYANELSPEDGEAYIKRIYGEHDKANAFWNRAAMDYIESQIMETVSLLKIRWGSGQQRMMSARALITYELKKREAAAAGKPLKDVELLELAHQVMRPFHREVKPLGKGEVLPETLMGRPVGVMDYTIPEPRTSRESLVTISEGGGKIIDTMTQPTWEQFIEVFNALDSPEAEQKYYNKWIHIFREKE